MFVHLHGHSHYSLLEAIGSPAKIIEKIKNLGMDTVGIVDFGAMYGALEFYLQAKKAGVKAIIGMELDIIEDISKKEIDNKSHQLVILTRDPIGYKNIIKLASIANTDGYADTPKIDMNILKQYAPGNTLVIGGEKTLLAKMITNEESDQKIDELINIYFDIFGQGNIVFEIIAQNYKIYPNLEKINSKLISLAQKHNIKLITGNNFNYIDKSDKTAYEVLLKIKKAELYNGQTTIQGEHHILSEEEIVKILKGNGFDDSFIQTLIQNNIEIAQTLDLKIPLGQIYFPEYKSTQDIIDLYNSCKEGLISE